MPEARPRPMSRPRTSGHMSEMHRVGYEQHCASQHTCRCFDLALSNGAARRPAWRLSGGSVSAPDRSPCQGHTPDAPRAPPAAQDSVRSATAPNRLAQSQYRESALRRWLMSNRRAAAVSAVSTCGRSRLLRRARHSPAPRRLRHSIEDTPLLRYDISHPCNGDHAPAQDNSEVTLPEPGCDFTLFGYVPGIWKAYTLLLGVKNWR
jgi:hypothetical protein